MGERKKGVPGYLNIHIFIIAIPHTETLEP